MKERKGSKRKKCKLNDVVMTMRLLLEKNSAKML